MINSRLGLLYFAFFSLYIFFFVSARAYLSHLIYSPDEKWNYLLSTLIYFLCTFQQENVGLAREKL